MIPAASWLCATALIALISVTEAANAQVYVAADNIAELYVNGILFSKTSEWQGFVQYDINLRVGDVIAIEAADLGADYGAIAAVLTKGKRCSTRPSKGPWRAIDFEKVKHTDWKSKGYDASFWPLPTTSSIAPLSPGSALGFPYKRTQAKYIWAKGVGVNGRIALRLDITDTCV